MSLKALQKRCVDKFGFAHPRTYFSKTLEKPITADENGGQQRYVVKAQPCTVKDDGAPGYRIVYNVSLLEFDPEYPDERGGRFQEAGLVGCCNEQIAFTIIQDFNAFIEFHETMIGGRVTPTKLDDFVDIDPDDWDELLKGFSLVSRDVDSGFFVYNKKARDIYDMDDILGLNTRAISRFAPGGIGPIPPKI